MKYKYWKEILNKKLTYIFKCMQITSNYIKNVNITNYLGNAN